MLFPANLLLVFKKKLKTLKNNYKNILKLQFGQMPNVMAALPNIGLCSTPQSLANIHYHSVVQYNAANVRKPLNLAGVPQTNEMISAASGPKFTIL